MFLELELYIHIHIQALSRELKGAVCFLRIIMTLLMAALCRVGTVTICWPSNLCYISYSFFVCLFVLFCFVLFCFGDHFILRMACQSKLTVMN